MMEQTHAFLTAAAQFIEAAGAGRLRKAAASARLSERERIARELHDTLLQGVQALMLNLQAVADRLRSESAQASQLIEQALARADAVLAEGRDRIKDLRTVVPVTT